MTATLLGLVDRVLLLVRLLLRGMAAKQLVTVPVVEADVLSAFAVTRLALADDRIQGEQDRVKVLHGYHPPCRMVDQPRRRNATVVGSHEHAQRVVICVVPNPAAHELLYLSGGDGLSQ